MAELLLETLNGDIVKVSGSQDEIAHILRTVGVRQASTNNADRAATGRGKRGKARMAGPTDLIRSLKEDGFFDNERSLSDVQEALKLRGRIYAVTSLSPLLVRLVRDRRLGRVRGPKGRWMYVTR